MMKIFSKKDIAVPMIRTGVKYVVVPNPIDRFAWYVCSVWKCNMKRQEVTVALNRDFWAAFERPLVGLRKRKL